jgi:hypothetical protein
MLCHIGGIYAVHLAEAQAQRRRLDQRRVRRIRLLLFSRLIMGIAIGLGAAGLV